jgi:RNA polymerase sigma-70 factor (ECF subfamily)
MAINRAVQRRAATAIDPEVLSNICVEWKTSLASVLDRERRCQVREGLVRLRAMDRETLTVFYVHGQSLTEMSDTFDAPVGTIKQRLHVARKRLAKEVEGQVARRSK